jgi:broad specificity phosphatase PhoE
MSTLYLVRHGQASFGTANYDRLSDTGREQVKRLAEYFAGGVERIDAIYSGTLVRQRETAQIIAAALGSPALEATVEPALDEYDGDAILREYAKSLTAEQLEAAGWPALKTDRRKFQLFLERGARAWVDAQLEAHDLLPWKGFHGRIVAALDDIMRTQGRSKTLIVSTSGGVIGSIVAHVLGLSHHAGFDLNWAVHNASITRLIYSADKVSLSMFNGLPHLDCAGRRELITYR